MTLEVLTRELITMDLDALSHGGKEAIALFMEMSRRLHELGPKDAMQDWITIAAPSLPEKERNEILVILMCSYLFLSSQTQAQNNLGAQSPTLH